MNRKYLLLIPIVLVLILVLALCTKSPNSDSVGPTTAPTENTTIVENTESAQKETIQPTTEEETQPKIEETNSEATESEEINHEDTSAGGYGTGDAEAEEPNRENDETQDDIKPTAPVNPQLPTEPQSCGCEYEQYLSMSAQEQQAYMNSFSSIEAFVDWSKAAAAAHEGHNTGVVVEGGDLDISDFIG